MKLVKLFLSIFYFLILISIVYFLYIKLFKVDVVFYASLFVAFVAVLLFSFSIYFFSFFEGFTIFEKAHEYLRRFEDGYGISKDEFYEMPKIHPELYEDLVRMASVYTKTDKIIDVAPESLIGLKYMTPEGGSIAYVHQAFAVLQRRCEDLVYIHQHLDHIRSAVTNIKEKRLLEALKDQGIMRAHEDLQRSFYKALNELRRHQTWRHGTIELGQGA